MAKNGIDVGRIGTRTDERFTNLVHEVFGAHVDSTFEVGSRP
jgi:hypothetical protein